MVVSPIATLVVVDDTTCPKQPPRSSADRSMEGSPAPATRVSELSRSRPVPHDLANVEVLHNELVTAQAKIAEMEEELQMLRDEKALSKNEKLYSIEPYP